MCMFLGLQKNETIVFEDEHRLKLSVVHMYSCLYILISEITTVSIDVYGTRVSLVLFPGFSRPSFCRLGNETINNLR